MKTIQINCLKSQTELYLAPQADVVHLAPASLLLVSGDDPEDAHEKNPYSGDPFGY